MPAYLVNAEDGDPAMGMRIEADTPQEAAAIWQERCLEQDNGEDIGRREKERFWRGQVPVVTETHRRVVRFLEPER
jgi:hypothetical protein